MEQITIRNSLATEMADAWPEHTPFMMQAGIKRTVVEEHAGLRERLLSSAEVQARDTVKAYFTVSMQLKTLWQDIKTTHPGALASDHEQYSTYNDLKTQRDSQAAHMAAFPKLYQRFFKLKANTVKDEVTGNTKVIDYVSVWGEHYAVRPASYHGMRRQGRDYGEQLRLQTFRERLTPEHAVVLDELMAVKQHHSQVNTIYYRIQELKAQPPLVDTIEYWQKLQQKT